MIGRPNASPTLPRVRGSLPNIRYIAWRLADHGDAGHSLEWKMSGDALSDLLRAVRLRGAVYYHVEGAPPWVADVPAAREIIRSIMPDADFLIEFHGVVRGSCWGGIVGETPLRLEAGDVILFPQGDAHVMSSEPGMRAACVDMTLYEAPRPTQLPYSLSMRGLEASLAPHQGIGPDGTNLICGFFGLDAQPFNPLLASLPRVLRVAGSSLGPDSWVTTFMRAGVVESLAKRPGGEAVLQRMSEMLFVEILRSHLESLPAEQRGWLAGMRDPGVGRALSLIHEKPGECWTLERLGEEAGLSRSTLHERFVHYIDQPPMQYLTQWRMQVASGMLRDTNAKLMEVAQCVGYDSEAAFSRAFKRAAGVSPGAWRKGERAGAPPALEVARA
jgi:AraC-like DNA-binding protein